jgi:hypothetical protein
MTKFERYGLLIILGTVPVIFGAVQSWVRSLYVAAIFLTFLSGWWRRQVRFQDNGRAAIWLVYLFLGWTLFQIVPLPGGILEVWGPFRAWLLGQARDLAGTASWESIAYVHTQALSQWSVWLAALLLAMLVSRACRERGFLTSLAVLLLMVGGLETLYGLVQALVPSTGVLGYERTGLGDARGTYINRNHFAGMVEMIWPLGLGYLLSLSPWEEKLKLKHLINADYFNRQLLIALILVVMFLALIFSRSRAGIMGMVLGFVAFMGVMTFSGAGLRKGFWIGTGIGVFLLLVYGNQIGFSTVMARFMQLDHANSRLDIWRDALVILQHHPLGVGAGNHQVVMPAFQSHFQASTTPVHTHNDYLQLLVETGWPGFLLLTTGWLYFLGRSLLGLRRFFKRTGYSTNFFVAAGAWSGLVSMGWHSFFDFNLQIPANLFYFAMLVGIVDRGQVIGDRSWVMGKPT